MQPNRLFLLSNLLHQLGVLLLKLGLFGIVNHFEVARVQDGVLEGLEEFEFVGGGLVGVLVG